MLRLSSQQLYQLLYDNRIRHPLVFLGVAGRSTLAVSLLAFSASSASFSSSAVSLLAFSTSSVSFSSSLRSPVRQPPFRGFPSPVPLQFSVPLQLSVFFSFSLRVAASLSLNSSSSLIKRI